MSHTEDYFLGNNLQYGDSWAIGEWGGTPVLIWKSLKITPVLNSK
jgi:hypothetical protein